MGTITNGTTAAPKKTLMVFDFDHTILDANTDVEIQGLTAESIPKEIRRLTENCWTDFMQAVFEFLHKHGKREEDYVQCLRRIPFTWGMKRLLREAGERPDEYEVLIISDSNSFFIDTILRAYELTPYVKKVLTNPAQFDRNGCLRIRYFQNQTDCEKCTKNLCKGGAMESYIKQRASSGVQFDRLIFIGDGKNDLCPLIKVLKEGDLGFARQGYVLEKLANDHSEHLKCNMHVFFDGEDILKILGLPVNSM